MISFKHLILALKIFKHYFKVTVTVGSEMMLK
jgi:hypothetical protein